MFRFTQAFLLLEVLVATAQGSDLCCADLKSDFKALQDLVQDLRTRLGDQTEKSPPAQNVQSSKSPTCHQTKVAFFVGLNKHLGPVTQPTAVVFDHVVTNNGSAYSAWSGRFTAPFSGTYQFSVTLAAQQTKQAAVSLLKNRVWVMTIWSVATPQWAPSSNVAILSLKAGDQVWIQQHTGTNYYVLGSVYTTFSGFLVFEN